MIKLNWDKVKIAGPKIDGSYTLSFDVGEYEQLKVALVLGIPQNTGGKLTIAPADESLVEEAD